MSFNFFLLLFHPHHSESRWIILVCFEEKLDFYEVPHKSARLWEFCFLFFDFFSRLRQSFEGGRFLNHSFSVKRKNWIDQNPNGTLNRFNGHFCQYKFVTSTCLEVSIEPKYGSSARLLLISEILFYIPIAQMPKVNLKDWQHECSKGERENKILSS